MWLDNIIPQLPTSSSELIIYIIAGLGAIMVVYSQFVEKENRRDEIRSIGALGILLYAYDVFNLVFMLVAGGIFLAALIELIEIKLGIHVHPDNPNK
ncbi:MAG: hypothetical protein KBD73_01455 [Candidatus Magasanikbacteria bacterium]|nr:hypothetical protein [Candidatus Magasanikbacteria bacterium]